MKTNFKKILFKLLLFLFVVLFCFIVGEITVYLLYRDQIPLFPRYVSGVEYGEYKIRRNIPNAVYTHKSIDGQWNFKINNSGFRAERNYSYFKNQDTIRVLVIGDSFTIGYEVDQNQTFSYVIENYLNNAGYPSEVINAGVSGFSTAEELVFYEQEGIKYDPDFVILGFYYNDLKDNVRANLFEIIKDSLTVRRKEYLPGIKTRDFLNSIFIYRWLSENSYFHNYLNKILTKFVRDKMFDINNNEHSGVVTTSKKEISNSYNIYQNNLAVKIIKRFYEIAQTNKTYFILLDIPQKDNLAPSFPDSSLAKINSDYYIDGSKILKPLKEDFILYQPHGQRHWTPDSHRIIGEKLAKVIIKLNGNNNVKD